MPECRKDVSPASAFRHMVQSGTAGHGLVRHCPAVLVFLHLQGRVLPAAATCEKKQKITHLRCSPPPFLNGHFSQRVLIDLQRAGLSCGRMIWLLASPFPLPSNRRHMGKLRLSHGIGGKEVGEEPNLPPQESLALYKSFNTL
jgi:hypothetical protein